jgi:NADH dehydrogenase [ubiquinone] 1 alpha subcomplex assembly factor 1
MPAKSRPSSTPWLLLLLTPLVAAIPTTASAAIRTDSTTGTILFQFSGAAGDAAWNAVNDDVMGGVSRGGAQIIDDVLHFRGTLSLENNGGFASVRCAGPTRDLGTATAMVLRVRGDGRTYRLQLATDASYRGARISYQAPFETRRGEWTEVVVPLASLEPRFRGQRLRGPPLDRSRITEFGLSLSDGNPGPFALEVDWIRSR